MSWASEQLAVLLSLVLVISVVSGVGLAEVEDVGTEEDDVRQVDGTASETKIEGEGKKGVVRKGSSTVINDCSNTVEINTGNQEVLIGSDLSTNAATCIVINASDIVVKGQFNEIKGPGPSGNGAGIDVGINTNKQLENITIKNVVDVKDFGRGIGLFGVDDFEINTVESINNGFGIVAGAATNGKMKLVNTSESQTTGILLQSSSNVTVTRSKILDNGKNGVKTVNTSDSTFKLLEISKNDRDGISLSHFATSPIGSNNNTLTRLTIKDNSRRGISIARSEENNVTGNTVVNSRTGIYLNNSLNNDIKDNTVKKSYNGILLGNSTGNNVTDNNNVKGGFFGIRLIRGTEDTRVTGNKLEDNEQGITVRSPTSSGAVRNLVRGNEVLRAKRVAIYDEGHGNRIIGNKVDSGTAQGIVIANTVSKTTVKRNKVMGLDSTGIYTFNASKTRVINNVVKNTKSFGVILQKSSKIKTKRNQVLDNSRWGIWLLGTNASTVKSNTLKNNGFLNSILINRSSHDNRIINNTIEKTKKAGGGYSIFVNESSNGNKLINNKIKDRAGNLLGIYVRSSNDTVIRGGVVHNTSTDAIRIRGSNRTTIQNVTAKNNSRDGIWIRGSNRTTIQNVTAKNNSGVGIRAIFSNRTTIQNVSVRNNTFDGISITFSNRTTIQNSTARNNGRDGIRQAISNRTVIKNNKIIGNKGGIAVALNNQTEIINNNITNNGNEGIRAVASNHTKIMHNMVKNHTQYGILLGNSNHTVTMDNTVLNNSFIGIGIELGINNTVYSNNATENNYGMRILDTSEANVSSNKMIRNKLGFKLEGPVNRSKIANNVIRNVTGFPKNPGYGMFLSESRNNVVINNTVEDINGFDFITDFSNVTVQSLNLPNMTVSFSAKNITLRDVGSPPSSPNNREGIGKYLNITKTSFGKVNWIDLEIKYSDSEVSNVKESSLGIWRNTSSGWSEVSGSSVNQQDNYVSVNLTNFGVFGVFGNKSESQIEYSNLQVSKKKINVSEKIEVTAKVENKGNKKGTYNASFVVNGNVRKYKNGTLSPGSSTTVSFKVSFSSTGEYDVKIDGLPAKTVNVTESGGDIQYSNLQISDKDTNVNEDVAITATVENKGTKEATYNASLKIESGIEKYENGTLSPGSSKTVSFEVSFSSPGEYDVTIDGLPPKTINVTGGGAKTIEEVIANLKSQNNIVNFSELQSAINFWIQDKEVPGTGGKKIDFAKLQDLISLWVQEKEV